MAEPAHEFPEIEPDITPHDPPELKGINGGGQSNSRRATLTDLSKQESNPGKPTAGSVAEQEAKGSNVIRGPWENKVTGAGAPKSGGMVASIKKKSPTLAIIITIVGLGGGVSLFGGSAMLPVAIMANVVQKFNTQETSLTLRTQKMLISKMASNATEGSCTIVKVFCRFSRPSNRFLSQLDDQGITAMDSKGNIISDNGLFPNTRPKSYRYFNSDGESVVVEAKDLKSALTNDPEFAARFSNATKTRFMSLTDSIFQSIKARFGFNTTDDLKTTTDEKSVTSEADTLSAVDDNGVKAAASEGEAAAKAEGTKVIEDKATKVADEVENSGKASAIGLIAAGVCVGTDVPGLIISASRDYQMAQLIRYSAVFLSAFGAIKAGDATPAEVGAIGAALTTVVKGKSAMDSFGMNYVMTGATTPKNNNYQKFSPGGSMISKFSNLASIGKDTKTKAACSVMTNPATGAAIDATLAANAGETLGATAVAAALNALLGYVGGYVVGQVLPTILDAVISHLPMESIMKYAFGDITQNLSGEGVGDALTSGASQMMGQTANAGGNMPLTTSQAVAYDNATKQVQIAYAKEDRATKSPLDASSPNTFLGSIVQKLIPYYADSSSTIGSVSNTFATIGKMVMGSFGLALQPLTVSAASNDQDQYKLCNDPEIANNDIAAGPFCNIIYGIPTQYLDKDPVAVVNDLIPTVDGGTGRYPDNVNADTGDPIAGSDLAKWLALCTDGTTDEANNCKITTDETADFALYTVDHRIQESMDTDETPNPNPTPAPAPAPEPTPTPGDAKQLAEEILANKKINLSYVDKAGFSPKQDVEDAAAGKVGTAGAMTSAAILQLIATVSQSHSVSISAIQSGGQGHCNNIPKSACPYDPHYTGDAVDFDMLDGVSITGRNAPAVTIIKIAEGVLPTGSGFGQEQCGPAVTVPSGWITFDDTCNHIHMQVPAGTP